MAKGWDPGRGEDLRPFKHSAYHRLERLGREPEGVGAGEEGPALSPAPPLGMRREMRPGCSINQQESRDPYPNLPTPNPCSMNLGGSAKEKRNFPECLKQKGFNAWNCSGDGEAEILGAEHHRKAASTPEPKGQRGARGRESLSV